LRQHEREREPFLDVISDRRDLNGGQEIIDRANNSAERNAGGNHSVKLPDMSAHVTLDEIQDVMADVGYSADQRKGWLKEVLTELTKEQSERPKKDRARLIEIVKEIADDNQNGKPLARDAI
jgi:hypothetical protein